MWINDNSFQWNDSKASAGVQCARITNKSLRFMKSQLSGDFFLPLPSSAAFFVCQFRQSLRAFLSPKNLQFHSSITQFIFLLSTRNCYYFAIKSSSLLIDLLESPLSRSSIDEVVVSVALCNEFPVIFPRSFSCNWIRFLPCNLTCFLSFEDWNTFDVIQSNELSFCNCNWAAFIIGTFTFFYSLSSWRLRRKKEKD